MKVANIDTFTDQPHALINDKGYNKTIGVLALQGAFKEHVNSIEKLGCKAVEVRTLQELNQVNGLIIPGGESTSIGKLLRDFSLLEPLKRKIREGFPVWGTCAGLILLAHGIRSDSTVHLGTMEIVAVRNAFGRQQASFTHVGPVGEIISDFPMVFIRAPFIDSVTNKVEVLAKVEGKIVAARQSHMLVTAFHPELTDDLRMHAYFINDYC